MKNLFYKIFIWLSQSQTILELPCYTAHSSKEENALQFDKLERALLLIKKYSPVIYAQLTGDVHKILLSWVRPKAVAEYIRELRIIKLDPDYILNEDTTVEMLASTIVHEAQHARLFRLGFGYDKDIRVRIERICVMSQRVFGLRIPNGAKVLGRVVN